MGGNALCGVKYGRGTYTAEGITKLCEGLKGSAVTSLRCAAAPSVNFPSTPVDACSLSPYPHLVPILRSLGCNRIGPQGAAKLAVVLSQTQITNLECAAPLEPDPNVWFPVSAR